VQNGQGLSGALARAIARFEAGLERAVVIDALNDYLLALRFVLEGAGPAHLGLSIRIAALCAEPEERGETKAIIDRAVSLERELWSGEPAPTPDGGLTPAQTAASVEDLARAILRDAACGHLGADLRSTADEILLADGLAVGEGRAEQRGESAEWDVARADVASEETREMSVPELDAALHEGEIAQSDADEVYPEPDEEHADEKAGDDDGSEPQEAGQQDTLWMDVPEEWETARRDEEHEPLQVPEARGRITVDSRPHEEEDTVIEDHSHARKQEPRTIGEAADAAGARVAELLEERPTQRGETAERVAYLFPRPETTEWNVRELSYDRRRRAQIS
jgi:hypothetical protein